jgi:HPr kinase/phosphorylase
MPINTPAPEAQTIKYGVFLEVLDTGVLLCGASGCGKSELALNLVDRGHRLIADDSVILMRYPESDKIIGTCPDVLADFLEVRGLGIINIRAMYGDTAIQDRRHLQLIVRLVMMPDHELESIDRLHGMHTTQTILESPIPEVTIPIAPGRNLAILVEAAVRNQILKTTGYQASLEFTKRHQTFIDAGNQEAL